MSEKISGRTWEYLNLGNSFQFYALLLLISLGYLAYASCVHKRQKITSRVPAKYERVTTLLLRSPASALSRCFLYQCA